LFRISYFVSVEQVCKSRDFREITLSSLRLPGIESDCFESAHYRERFKFADLQLP